MTMTGKQKNNPAEDSTELEWLRWFAQEAVLGPAHTEIVIAMEEAFERETGKKVPKDWSYRGE